MLLSIDWEEGELKGPDTDYDHPIRLALEKVINPLFFSRYAEQSNILDIYLRMEPNPVCVHSVKIPENIRIREKQIELGIPDIFLNEEVISEQTEKIKIIQDLEEKEDLLCHMKHPVCRSINKILKEGHFTLFDLKGRVEVLKRNPLRDDRTEHVMFIKLKMSPPYLNKEFNIKILPSLLHEN